MLGRLARYLRLLGYDTSFPPPCPDSRLLGLARAEGRVLLTRDRGIVERCAASPGLPLVVEISSSEVMSQVEQLVEEGWLTRVLPPRCGDCNTPLQDMDPREARHLLPRYTLATQTGCLFCPTCNMALWRGTHWDHFITAVLSITRLH